MLTVPPRNSRPPTVIVVAEPPSLRAALVPAQRTGTDSAVNAGFHFLPCLLASTTELPSAVARSTVREVPVTEPAWKPPPPLTRGRELSTACFGLPRLTLTTLASSVLATAVPLR